MPEILGLRRFDMGRCQPSGDTGVSSKCTQISPMWIPFGNILLLHFFDNR